MRTLMLFAAVFLAGLTADASGPDEPNAIRLGRTSSGLMTVPVTIRNREFTFLLDTGSARSVLSRAAADEIRLSVQPGARMIGTTGTKDVSQAWVDQLRVGRVTIDKHLVVVADLAVLNRYDIKVDGLLGADVLIRGEMRLDFERGELWLSTCNSCTRVAGSR